jgi:Flp pilus assembly protein TadG
MHPLATYRLDKDDCVKRQSERGAVAVELAILLPVLLVILLGIVEFGRVFNAQISLTQAAREGARVMAVTNDLDAASAATIEAGVALNPKLISGNLDLSSTNIATSAEATGCLPGNQATVSINYELPAMTGFIGPLTLTATGAMRCGG